MKLIQLQKLVRKCGRTQIYLDRVRLLPATWEFEPFDHHSMFNEHCWNVPERSTELYAITSKFYVKNRNSHTFTSQLRKQIKKLCNNRIQFKEAKNSARHLELSFLNICCSWTCSWTYSLLCLSRFDPLRKFLLVSMSESSAPSKNDKSVI